MQVHSLELDDFCEDDYALIGIHTALEDFKLAYLLNNVLKTQFKRADFSLDFDKKSNVATFSIYSYNNEKYDFEWYLISNSHSEELEDHTGLLALNTETISYLIPEKKRVDYFLKIVGDYHLDFIEETVKRINSLSQVVTSYTIEKDTLKSREFLIF